MRDKRNEKTPVGHNKGAWQGMREEPTSGGARMKEG